MAILPQKRKLSLLGVVRACDAELGQEVRNPIALHKRAEACRKLGEHRQAVADLNAALAIDPGNARALAARGACWRALARHQEALADFDAAVALEPKSAPMLVGRSSVRQALGESEAAIADLSAAIKLEPHSALTWQLRGELQRKLGKHAEALADFNVALRLDARCVLALAGRAALPHASEKVPEAIADFNKALALAPKNASVLGGRGALRLELGLCTEAMADFEAALRTKPQDNFAAWGLALAKRLVSREPVITSVELAGFRRRSMNTLYAERHHEDFKVDDHDTYWSMDGEFFLYWCSSESRWKGSRASDFAKVRGGGRPGFIAAPLDDDILFPSSCRGWHEWDGKTWVLEANAGIANISALQAPRQVIALSGFSRSGINGEYEECRRAENSVGGRETYWATNGRLFLYWCGPEGRWKGSRPVDLAKIRGGGSSGLIGSPVGVDVLHRSQGWHEWDGSAWVHRPGAGSSGARRIVTQSTPCSSG